MTAPLKPASDAEFVDRVIAAVINCHDNSELWAHARRDPEAFRSAVRHVMMSHGVTPNTLPKGQAEKALRDASDAFYRIGAALNAERLLAREGYKMTTPLFESLVGKKLTPYEISKAAADGFELCVRALAEMGAPDVTIHECGARAFEEHW